MRRDSILLPSEAVAQVLRRSSKEGSRRVGANLALRTKVTLEFAIQSSGLPHGEFAKNYLYRGRSNSGLIDKWRSGKTALYRNSALALEKHFPGTLKIFELPLFDLLTDASISEKRVEELLRKYLPQDGEPRVLAWRFPDTEAKIAEGTYVPVLVAWDTAALRSYGTVESFCAILGVMRAAEARGNLLVHLAASQDLFRALPMVLKFPWFAVAAKDLGKQLFRLRNRVLQSQLFFDVDWRLIRRQGRDPLYHPFRYTLPKWPDGRFVEPMDPVLPAAFVPGRRQHREHSKRSFG